jgi:hypothetical protein
MHDPEKWAPVSRLREAVAPVYGFAQRSGGRRQVGQDHAQKMHDPEKWAPVSRLREAVAPVYGFA